MLFKSDRQRRAVFANMGGRFSCQPPKLVFASKSIGDLRQRSEVIERLLKSKNLNDFQKDRLRKEKDDIEREMEVGFAKRPQEIGSVWVGGKYVHGPRIRQPKEFEFIKNVDPAPKFYHLLDADKIPETLPRGSKLVVGKLRKSGDWALQSTLIPKDSKLGKSLIER